MNTSLRLLSKMRYLVRVALIQLPHSRLRRPATQSPSGTQTLARPPLRHAWLLSTTHSTKRVSTP